jgi:hypothetical protein
MAGYKKGGHWDEQYKHGGKMGYARGGQTKNTSGEFVEKRSGQDDMDHANMQDRSSSRNASSQRDVESAGTRKLRPKMKAGGKVKHPGKFTTPDSKGKVKGKGFSKSKGVALRENKRQVAANQKMPPNVKRVGGPVKAMHGGKMENYSEHAEGRRRKSGAGMPSGVKAKGGKMKYPHSSKYAEGGLARAAPSVKVHISRPMVGRGSRSK